MTELSFLVDLLINHKLQKATRDAVAKRIGEVEESLSRPQLTGLKLPGVITSGNMSLLPPQSLNQSPSTIANMVKHGELPPSAIESPMAPEPVQPAVVAQTPATMAAMESRHAAMTGVTNKLTGRPRKF